MSSNSDETIPQIALFIQESSARPPPPPLQATSNSVPRTPARPLRPMIVPMQHLPPPPPPPPLSAPSTSTSQLHNSFYRAQSPRPSTSYAICHPPTGIPMFDASRPHPPIHNHSQSNNNIFKRSTSDCCTAGPSKLRRTEELKPDDAMCDACVQREISIESYRIQLEKLSAEDECQTILLKKKQNEYLRQKEILRSLVDSNLFRKIEEFVEDVPQYNFQSVFNNLNDSFRTGTSSIPNQMLLQFMEYFLSDSSKFESSQSARAQDTLRQTLSAMSRSPVRRASPDFLKTLQNILNNEDRPSSTERSGYGDTSVERAHSSSANGVSSYRRYSNGQRVEPRVVPRVEHRAPPPPTSFPPPTQQPTPGPRPPASELTPPAVVAPPAPPPAAMYPHYPPPPRAYYPPRYLPPRYLPPRYLPEPTPSTSRAPIQPYPPYPGDRYPSPYYYYQ